MFHVLMAVVVLGEIMVIGLVASRWTLLSLLGITDLCARGLSTSQAAVSLGMRLDVSVAVQFLMR